jgi:hypothetical protein
MVTWLQCFGHVEAEHYGGEHVVELSVSPHEAQEAREKERQRKVPEIKHAPPRTCPPV